MAEPDDDLSWEDASDRVDPEPFLLAIKSGDYDMSLVKIIEACRDRFAHGNTAQRWAIEYEGETFTQDDLTLAEARTVEKETGGTWAFLNPAGSAQHCIAVVVACLHHRHGLKINEARDKVGGWTVEDAVKAITSYEVEVAPKGSET